MTDFLGTSGDSAITGTAGNDTIEAGSGSDIIESGDGNDVIVDSGWLNDTIHAGDGDDRITFRAINYSSVMGEYIASTLIDAGAGNDFVTCDTGFRGATTIDLGSGSDVLVLDDARLASNLFYQSVTISLGTGTDRLVLGWGFGASQSGFNVGPVEITDFEAGAGGDSIELGRMLGGLLSSDDPLAQFTNANPFAAGILRLVQQGADTVLVYDRSPDTPAYDDELLILRNVTISQLTAYNFGGFDPAGGSAGAVAVGGTSGNDLLQALAGGGSVNGLGGDDWLHGTAGADSLSGGDGNDTISGSFGNDAIDGGEGNDTIEGGEGSDHLIGGNGDDLISDSAFGNDAIDAGGGDDTITLIRPVRERWLPALADTVSVLAGDGNDTLRVTVEFASQTSSVPMRLTADLGAGNDDVYIDNSRSSANLTLGGGTDRVTLGAFYDLFRYNSFDLADPISVTIEDFQAGAGGDVLDLNALLALSDNWVVGANPFASGHLRLLAQGNDTIVGWDLDGAGGSDSVDRLILLRGVSASTLTAENFAGNSSSMAPTVNVVLAGTAGTDTIHGGDGNDSLDGLDGNDRLFGGAGNDQIAGGIGNDLIEGGAGGDTISGGAGDDTIRDEGFGAASIDGGDGNDHLIVNIRLLDGAIGTVLGGAGDDLVEFSGFAGTGLSFDLGDGNDRAIVYDANVSGAVFSLGAGSDVVTLDRGLTIQPDFAITISDFQTGAGGDVLDWVEFVRTSRTSWDFGYFYREDGSINYNPFAEGRARLVQSGSDTLLQFSSDAGDYGGEFSTLVTFLNTDIHDFTADNLGFNPLVENVAVSGGADTFAGTAGADVALASAGDDQLAGLGGDDVLNGGDGDDVLDGGDGNDWLAGGVGANTVSGGSGDDYIVGLMGNSLLDGGDGHDTIRMASGNTVTGGTGNDTITLRTIVAASGSIEGGDGDDLVVVDASGGGSGPASLVIDLGAGNDRILTNAWGGSLTLGAGNDRVELGASHNELVITDFQAGDGGDVLSMQYGLAAYFNPFAVGAARLVQDGADVVLTFDAEVAFAIQLLNTTPVRFQNTTLAQFTAHNFDGIAPVPFAGSMPVDVSSDLTITAGSSVSLTNPLVGENIGSGYIYRSSDGNSQFVNHGTVSITTSVPYPSSRVTGIWIDGRYPISAQSLFNNAADGHFTVTSDAAYVVGFYGFGATIPFVNAGEFSVRSSGLLGPTGVQIGVMSGYSQGPVTNSGSISVSGGTEVYGLSLGPGSDTNNSGSILATSDEFAVGIYVNASSYQQLNNQGSIMAVTPLSSPYASIGVLMNSLLQINSSTIASTFKNSGTITADIAFYALEGTDGYAEQLINSGQIHGAVLTGRADDVVINTGSMDSRLLLGGGNDRYDGALGQHTGSIEGQDGNDTLIGGGGSEDLFGGQGEDVISAGGGDDFVEGGAGFDMLDGGDGFDVLSFLGSTLAVNVDLGTGIAATTQDRDGVRNFEEVVGSRGGDAIAGATAADFLLGIGGNDAIDGRGGDDVIWGGTGTDVLTGGAGADRFIFDVGDGNDVITDFDTGDTIEIYGYATYQSLVQEGADLRIVLSASDSVLVRNATAASLKPKNLLFDSGPTGLVVPQVPDETIRTDRNYVVVAGTVLDFTDTAPTRLYNGGTTSTAVVLSPPYYPTGFGIWNSGTIRYSTNEAVDLSRGVAGSESVFVNQAGALLQVDAAQSDALGVSFNVSFNYGAIVVSSATGDANGVMSGGYIGSSGTASYQSVVLNQGSITVNAAGAARGMQQLAGNSTSAELIFNSGQITVHGGSASSGIEDYLAGVGNAAPHLVNSGTINVTDETADLDSAGLVIGIASHGTVWNSGTITADYAVKCVPIVTYSASSINSFSLDFYNSGTLNGQVLLSNYNDLLVNTNAINGDVNLAGGDDVFDGRLGTLTGTLDGYDGNDTLLTGAGSQTIRGGFGNDVLSGGAGADILNGGAGVDTFRFGAGFGADIVEDFQAGASHDWIDVGDYSAYQSIVQQGGDVLITFAASDTLLVRSALVADVSAALRLSVAPIAANTIPTAPVAPAAPPSPPAQTAPAGLTYLPIVGTANDDVLGGALGPDTIMGLAGNDSIDGGLGADLLFGGTGNDTYYADSAADLVFENSGEGADTVVASAGYYLFANVENLVLSGTASNFGVGNDLANTITGNSGSNLLLGGLGDDVLSGGDGVDSLFGQDGVDTLNGDGGVDYLVGGLGNDVLHGGADADALYGEDGDDLLDGGASFDTDILVGGAGNDTLDGVSGQANPDYDLMDGGAGDDIYWVDTGDDLTFEAAGGGTDTVHADVTVANAGVYLWANVENLVLEGTTAFGVGNELDNQLTGSASGNWLLGGLGADTINGMAGNDVLFGEGGADTFVFGAGSGADVIGDFLHGTDKIQLNGIYADFASLQSHFIQVGDDGAIDLGGGNLIVLLGTTMSTLTAGDFIFAPAGEAAPKGLAVMEAPAWQDEPLLADPAAPGHGYWAQPYIGQDWAVF